MEEPLQSNPSPIPATTTVGVANKNNSYEIEAEPLSLALDSCKRSLGIPDHSIQIIATNETEIQQINKDYRDKDQITDVISFTYAQLSSKPSASAATDQTVSGAEQELGDIFVCMEKTASQAKDIGQSISDEFIFLCIHGLLHLCGYDHQNPEEEREMISQQKKLISHLKESGVYPQDFIKAKSSDV